MTRSTGILLNAHSSEPLHKQIFDQIVDCIRTHAFPEGFRLPPTRQLADELSTHRNTVVRAYEDLEAAGFVTSTVGRGTFVASQLHTTNRPKHFESKPSSLAWDSLVSRVALSDHLHRTPHRLRTNHRPDIINLARMQPSADLVPDELLRRCIEHTFRTLGSRALQYSPLEGIPALRERLASDLAIQGVPAKADDILITTGSQQALDLIARALIDPGDSLLVDTITYGGALNVFTAAGARLISVPYDAEGPDLNALQNLTHSGAKAFYLMPNSHNPTGITITETRRHALIEWSHKAGIPLIEDDYGADLNLTEIAPPVALKALDANVIYLGTFSKKLAPALRVGFIVCPPALKPALLSLKYATDLGTSALLQYTLAEFLDRGYMRAHLNRILPEYRLRRDALIHALTQLPRNIRYQVPHRGVVLWLSLPSSLNADTIYDEAQKRGVLISPSSLNTVSTNLSAQGIRLTFCAESQERIAEGGRKLSEMFRTLLKQRDEKDTEFTFEPV